ncbi:TonB-dependent receptor plug domain-containing protein [Desulfospira joergensenii]|uniref:TonB-dependent receptor plug domain-containing protein n=1 Tax=Desulfospira joergensenii TaxID=53329 RepID=UPI0003B651A4|nr:TonB-dependent receptor [Desulfospira joergensenii]
MKRIFFKRMCLPALFLLMTTGGYATPNEPQVFNLGEVVITGEKTTVNLATTVTEVSMEEIAAKGATSAAEALEFLPGVFVRYGGKGDAHVNIRGFEQRQVKILIDGVPARENYFGTVDLSMLPADAISKITIVKGASSVLYGSNTMGGVINIITKKGSKTPQTLVSSAFGDYDTARYAASHGGTFTESGRINYWLSAGYQTSDGYRLSHDFDPNNPVTGVGTQFNEDGGVRDLSHYNKKNLNMKVGYDPGGESSLYLSFNYVDNDRGIPAFFNRYWAYDHWKQWQISLAGEHRFTDKVKVKSRVFYVNHEDGITDVSWDKNHTTGGRKWFEQSFYDDDSVGGEFQVALDLIPSNTLRLGVNFMEDNHREGNYLSDDCWAVTHGSASVGWAPQEEYAARTWTLAVEDEFSLLNNLSIVVGISWDVFEPTQTSSAPAPGQTDTLNPQIGAVYDITPDTSLHASVGRKTKFPSLKELYSDLVGGNPDLNPERTLAYEAGVTHAFPNKIEGNLAFFYNDIDDLIDMTTIGGERAYVNINKAVIYGAEAGLSVPVCDTMDLYMNYTWLNTEDKSNNGRNLEGRPRHRINLGLAYRFAFGLTADLNTTYNRRQYWENSDTNEWTELPDYFLVNLKLTQKLPRMGKVAPEIFALGTNLLDKDYYETNGAEPGFNFLAGMTLKF